MNSIKDLVITVGILALVACALFGIGFATGYNANSYNSITEITYKGEMCYSLGNLKGKVNFLCPGDCIPYQDTKLSLCKVKENP